MPLWKDSLRQAASARWWIAALLFASTTINYIDRNSLSVLKTTLERELGWTAIDYGWITTAFTFAYGLFPSLIGFFVDRVGVKKALAGALILWSLAAAAHGLVATVVGFVIGSCLDCLYCRRCCARIAGF